MGLGNLGEGKSVGGRGEAWGVEAWMMQGMSLGPTRVQHVEVCLGPGTVLRGKGPARVVTVRYEQYEDSSGH